MIRRRKFLSLSAAGAVAGCDPAPPADPPAPPPVSEISGAAPQAEAVRAFLAAFAARQKKALHVPAFSAALALPDGTIVASAAGWADPENRIAVTPATRFMSGSTGKTFAAALALTLVQAGKLSLDAPLTTLFAGEAWFAQLPNHAALTPRLLLHHAGGFPQFLDQNGFRLIYFCDSLLGRDVSYSPRRMLGFIEGAAPLNAPGAAFNYSDLGYDLIGLTIEKITGKPYMQALHDEILAPLGYSEVSANLSTNLPGLAAGYARGGFLENLAGLSGRVTRANGSLKQSPVLEYAGGGLNLTARALARFYHDLLNERVLNAATTATMVGDVVKISSANGVSQAYGLGIFVTQRDGFGTYYSHSGYYPGYVSVVGFFRQSGVAIALQVNNDTAELAPVLRLAEKGVRPLV